MKKIFAAIGHGLYCFARLLIHGILRFLILLAFRPKVYYASEKAKQEAFREPSVMICNHVYTLDYAVTSTGLLGKRIAPVIAKDMVDKYGSLRWLMKWFDHIAIDRNSTAMDLTWLRKSRELLKDGEHIFVCPEGKTNRKLGKVTQEFRAGFLTVPAMTGAWIVPVYHNGEYNWFHGKRFKMMVGEPMKLTPAPKGLTQPELEREAKLLHDTVCELEMKLNGSVRH